MPNYSHATKLTMASAIEEPPYLTVGTDVSAKYKGAFCEAKITDVNKHVKLRVSFDGSSGTHLIDDTDLKNGSVLEIGSRIEARHPGRKQQTYLQASITKILDHSRYTVVFDDGDQCVLRRNSLCLKSGKHFAESETLDQLPLTNPEHFGNPVKVGAIDNLTNNSSSSSTQISNHRNKNLHNNHSRHHHNNAPPPSTTNTTPNTTTTERQRGKSNHSNSNLTSNQQSQQSNQPNNTNNHHQNNNNNNNNSKSSISNNETSATTQTLSSRKRQHAPVQDFERVVDNVKRLKKERNPTTTNNTTLNPTSASTNNIITNNVVNNHKDNTSSSNNNNTSNNNNNNNGNSSISATPGRRGPTKGRKRRESVNGVKNDDAYLNDSIVDCVDTDESNINSSSVKFELIDVGVKLMIQYGKEKAQNVYEAKVNKIEITPSGKTRYFVHYTGWNNRYDEWITKNRILSIVTEKENGSKDGRSKNHQNNCPLDAINSSQTPSTTPSSATATTAPTKDKDIKEPLRETKEPEKETKEPVKQAKESIKQPKESVKQPREPIKQQKELVKPVRESVKQTKETNKHKEPDKTSKELEKVTKEPEKVVKESEKPAKVVEKPVKELERVIKESHEIGKDTVKVTKEPEKETKEPDKVLEDTKEHEQIVAEEPKPKPQTRIEVQRDVVEVQEDPKECEENKEVPESEENEEYHQIETKELEKDNKVPDKEISNPDKNTNQPENEIKEPDKYSSTSGNSTSRRSFKSFCEEINEPDCDKKISILQNRIMALRQRYISLKTALSNL